MNWDKIVRRDHEGQIVGELEWRESPGRTFELHVDVHPAHHRKGIGRKLVEELEKLVAGREPMSLYTFMAADNLKARQFFAAVGFNLILAPNFYGRGRDAYFGIKVLGAPK